jgi:urea transport system substrate-binding protein
MEPVCPPRERLEQLTAKCLPPDELASVQTHVGGCTLCQQALADLSAFQPTKSWAPPPGTDPEPERAPAPEELRNHPRYRVIGVLGRGGMGAVYKAEHRLLERPVVLKVIRPDLVATPALVQRFQREARLAARMSHPNVVAVYEAEAFEATQMLVMEYVEGVTLAHLTAERGLLPIAEACELVRQTAIGLDYIHERGMVHRDIKPANLMVSNAGQVKVLDLGLATLKDGPKAEGNDLTAEGQFLGTVDYAAPEQWESSRDVDIRADVYSLGCTLYYLLAGEAPFSNKRYTSLMQKMWAHSQAPLPPIRDLRPDVPDELVAVLNRMLAKNRDQRFARPSHVAEALAPYTQDCNLAEFVRTTRRTTTSKLDMSKVSSTGTKLAAAPPAGGGRAPPRRVVLGAAVLLCAVLALALAVAFGGRGGKPEPAPGAGAAAPSGPPIKVGILHSRTGTMAISERSVIDATVLAIEELNARGGVLGRPVEAVIEDGRSDAAAFAAGAEKLIAKDGVSAVFGCWTSASRKTVLPVIEKRDHLLFYPVQYEGLEQSPHVVYTGAAPNQQIIPAVKWCASVLKKKRPFLVGSDYVFPRTANAIIRDEAAAAGMQVVGEEYLALGTPNVQGAVKAIAAAKPDVILNTINGDTVVPFFRALRAAGVTPDAVPTVSFSISEEELRGLNTKDLVGDYAAWNYFETVDRPQNRAFVERFRARFGRDRAVSDPMEAAYAGVHLWAQAVAAAGDPNPAQVRAAVRGQSFDAPGGPRRVDPETLHTTKAFRVGRVTAESRFEIVYNPETAIAPQPYPLGARRRADWDAFLLDLNMRWGGRWENPASP